MEKNEVIEKIYTDYYRRVYSFLFRLCGDRALAEDLTQETFYQAFISLRRFKGSSEVFTWLAAIAKHMYLKYLRRMRMSLEVTDIGSVVDSICASEETPEEALERKDVEQAVRRVVKRIPEKYGEVVMLRVYAGLPFSQVSKALGISENSAKVIYCRAKKMLTEELRHEFEL